MNIHYMVLSASLTALQLYGLMYTVRPTSASHMHVIITHNTGDCHLSMDKLFQLAFLITVIAYPSSRSFVLLIDLLT